MSPQSDLHPEPIVIIGMQRSGTSALAGALAELGVSFGDPSMLYAADSNNATGYFEHRKATILNLRWLETFGMHPISFGRLPADWAAHPEARALSAELESFITSEFAGKGRWAIKQPLTSLVLPPYLAVFRKLKLRPHFVMCVRHPLEAMASEVRLRFDGAYRVMPSLGETAVGSWLRYTLGPFADLADPAPPNEAGVPRITVVPYEQLLGETERSLRGIVDSHPDWRPSEDQWSRAIGSIRGDLRNHRLSASDLGRFPDLVRLAYDGLMACAAGDRARAEELRHLEGQFRVWVDMLAEPPPPARKLGLAWRHDGEMHVAETRYSPSGCWQTVRLTVSAPGKTPLSGILYPLPCRIWIRRLEWRHGHPVVPAELRAGPASSLSRSGGFLRLDAAYEPNQIQLVTPDGEGPFHLEIDLWLQASPTIESDIAARLGRQLDECARSAPRPPR